MLTAVIRELYSGGIFQNKFVLTNDILFVKREIPMLFPVNCERTNLFSVKRDLDSPTLLGDRSFVAAAPALWNKLPRAVRHSQNVQTFKKALKTHLFRKAYNL